MRVGEPVGVDVLEEPPEGRSARHVGRLRLTSARATGEHAADAATNVGDDPSPNRQASRTPLTCYRKR